VSHQIAAIDPHTHKHRTLAQIKKGHPHPSTRVMTLREPRHAFKGPPGRRHVGTTHINNAGTPPAVVETDQEPLVLDIDTLERRLERRCEALARYGSTRQMSAGPRASPTRLDRLYFGRPLAAKGNQAQRFGRPYNPAMLHRAERGT